MAGQCLDRDDNILIEIGQCEYMELFRHKTEARLVRRPRKLSKISFKHKIGTK